MIYANIREEAGLEQIRDWLLTEYGENRVLFK